MGVKAIRTLVLLLFGLVSAFAQRPVINAGGVVNAASFAGASQPASAIVRGAIASIFGQNLAPEIRQAEMLPLPRSLAGTSVTVEGIAAPLFYVSPTQINFQVPSELPDLPVSRELTDLTDLDVVWSQPVRVVVTTAAGVSEPVVVGLAQDAAGIFTQEARGCGHGAVLNVLPDGSRRLNSPTESIPPGGFVSIFATGLGPVIFPPDDGEAASSERLSHTQSGVAVYLGPPGFARLAFPVTYSGRAPGLVGVDQIDVRIPDDAPEGCAVPLTVGGLTRWSQPVTVSIRRGGGQCQDAQLARFGSLRWHRIVASEPQSSVSTTQETFTASFAEAPANQVIPLSASEEVRPKPGPRCPGTGLRTLRVGTISLEGVPSGPITVSPSTSLGEVTYTATLPSNSIKRGTVRVLAAGGPEVGSFQASLQIPPPIEITTALPPGTVIPQTQSFRVTWTGGSPDALVRVRLASYPTPITESAIECSAPASSGACTVELIRPFPDGPAVLPVIPSDDVRVTVIVGPGAGRVQTFSAPGFTREGTHEWSYEYRFTGLKIR